MLLIMRDKDCANIAMEEFDGWDVRQWHAHTAASKSPLLLLSLLSLGGGEMVKFLKVRRAAALLSEELVGRGGTLKRWMYTR